jgi:glycine/D-amino acid oxidase-like deaminating enzyme
LRRVGSLRLAADGAERDACASAARRATRGRFAVEWLYELAAPLVRLYRGAILHPHDGSLVPARWVRRLARHAADAGADVRERSPVTVDELDADAIVVACDGFTASLLPELREQVVPTRGQVLVTEPLAERVYERPHYARGGYDYWQQLPDGRVVIGGQRDAAFAEEETDVEDFTDLVQGASRTSSEQLLATARQVAQRWAGIGAPRWTWSTCWYIPGRERRLGRGWLLRARKLPGFCAATWSPRDPRRPTA